VRIAATTLLVLLVAPMALGQGAPPASVRLDMVRQEVVREQVTGVATVEPWLRTSLSTEIAGLVETYPLREGDEVIAGKTLVCELKKKTLLIDLAEAEALLARAQAETDSQVETARATMEEMAALMAQAERSRLRAVKLLDEKVITQAELDDAEAAATAAISRHARARKDYELALQGADPAAKAREAEVRRAKARLDRVRDQIEKTTIKSPVNGRVVRRLTEVGSWVSAGSPVLEIVTLDRVLIRVGVNERDVAKIALGNPVIIRVDAHPGRKFSGEVRYLVPEAGTRTRSFPVLIEVPNPDGALLAGMFARVSIGCGEGRPGLTVHKDAVVTGPQGSVVWTLGEMVDVKMGDMEFQLPSAKMIPVKVGLAVDDRVEVRGPGLGPDMPVVTTGNEQLFPGRPLSPPRPKPEEGAKPESGEPR